MDEVELLVVVEIIKYVAPSQFLCDRCSCMNGKAESVQNVP